MLDESLLADRIAAGRQPAAIRAAPAAAATATTAAIPGPDIQVRLALRLPYLRCRCRRRLPGDRQHPGQFLHDRGRRHRHRPGPRSHPGRAARADRQGRPRAPPHPGLHRWDGTASRTPARLDGADGQGTGLETDGLRLGLACSVGALQPPGNPERSGARRFRWLAFVTGDDRHDRHAVDMPQDPPNPFRNTFEASRRSRHGDNGRPSGRHR
jgi:hypothetical protein